jgi:hypothetical protein
MRVGRTIAVAVLGFLFMLFVAADLVLFGVVPMNSVVVTILPLLGLIMGVVLGIVAGDRRAPMDEPAVQNGSPV